MATMYIGIILLFRVVQALFNKRSSMEVKNIPMLVGYNAYKNAISAALGLGLILFAANGFRVNWLTVVIASVSGLALFFAGFCSIYAMKSGTVSLNSMFGTAGMIVPVLAGVFLFHKPIAPLQWAGLAVFFLSAWLLIGGSKAVYAGFSGKTLLLLIGSLMANGTTMLAQQMFTAYVPDGDVSVFSFFSFAIIAAGSGIFYKFLSAGNCEGGTKLNKPLLVCGVALAVSVFIINQLATLSTRLISPVILFAFINGGGTIISTVVAALVYKEKISKKTAAGILLGITSLLLIKFFEI